MARRREKTKPLPPASPERRLQPVADDPRGTPSTASLAPAFVRRTRAWSWWTARPVEGRQVALVAAFAALITVPFLGSVGLWDPWETHYAEVARSMIVREDYVHPFWERAYFFSKPVFSMWMMALGMNVVGALDGPAGALSIYTEWGVRLPFALLAIGTAVAAYLAAGRIWTRRAGLFTALVLATMPFFFLLARQAMMDMPLVALMSSALFAFMVAVFDRRDDEAPRAGWLYAFYVLVGLATLAKGLLGVLLPGAVIFVWMLVANEWRLLPRLRIPTGALVFLAVAAPWYAAMILFDGKDDEFKTFWTRFFIHDHFNRLGRGVHTTTPGGTFAYYIEQLGFGIFPWVALVPGALAQAARRSASDRRAAPDRALLFVLVWLVFSYVLFSLGSTKFHHYAFPMVPPLAVLIALYLDGLWDEEDLGRHRGLLLLGLAIFAVVAQNLVLEPKHLTDLFVYKYDRPYPGREVDPASLFGAAFAAAGVLALAGFLWRRRRMVAGTVMGLAVAFAVYVSWVHWPALSFHWSQRDLFWTYYQDRQADEPIAAYLMNWRGETFYSQNSVLQVKKAGDLRQFAARPGTEYVLVEQGRYKGMRSVLSGHRLRILDRSNNKFYLVRIDARDPS